MSPWFDLIAHLSHWSTCLLASKIIIYKQATPVYMYKAVNQFIPNLQVKLVTLFLCGLLSLILLFQLLQLLVADWWDRNIIKSILTQEGIGIEIYTDSDGGQDSECCSIFPEVRSSSPDHSRCHFEGSWIMIWRIFAIMLVSITLQSLII